LRRAGKNLPCRRRDVNSSQRNGHERSNQHESPRTSSPSPGDACDFATRVQGLCSPPGVRSSPLNSGVPFGREIQQTRMTILYRPETFLHSRVCSRRTMERQWTQSIERQVFIALSQAPTRGGSSNVVPEPRQQRRIKSPLGRNVGLGTKTFGEEHPWAKQHSSLKNQLS
jgi:hypothetical protein